MTTTRDARPAQARLFEIRRVWKPPSKISFNPNGPARWEWELRRAGLHVDYYNTWTNAIAAANRRINYMRAQELRKKQIR